jgi:glutamate 5-kinase
MKIGIKLGSMLITGGNGKVDVEYLNFVCEQIAKLKKDGHQVFLVTSGAIASDQTPGRSENARASVGQGRLIRCFIDIMESYNINVAQLLPTYVHLQNKDSDYNHVFIEILNDKKLLPVINYNDPVDSREIKQLHYYADNDNLLLAHSLVAKADLAIIAISEKCFRDRQGAPIYQARLSEKQHLVSCCQGGNACGHGKEGMKTKIFVLCSLAEKKIRGIMAPGKEENFILRAVNQEPNFGLTIEP